MALNAKDVSRLATDSSANVRVDTANKLAADVASGQLTDSERAIADDILRALAKDVEVRVREALSHNLKHCRTIPHDLAIRLAKDVDSVALPVLSFSQVLTAEDLVAVIQAQASVGKMAAIAERPFVASQVVNALVEHGNETVVAKTVANPGAAFQSAAFDRVIDRFGNSHAVQAPLVARADLPAKVIERLIHVVSNQMRATLLEKQQITPDLAMDLVLASRERATVNIAQSFSDAGLAAFVAQLHRSGGLTSSLVLRAVCMGHLHFFEHAIAALAHMPLAEVLVLLRNPNGLRHIWIKAGQSQAYYPAVRSALDAVLEIEREGRDLDAETFSCRIVERIMTHYETFGVEFEHDDLEYLFARVGAVAAESAAPN
ncbi:MAG: DUF2336 domain-containing protein [Rhodospirillaceae bacterium]|nr:DUF2336 domain-containing protein [Rhodospirillaceae bacterium]